MISKYCIYDENKLLLYVAFWFKIFRQEKAKLLGYDNYATMSLSTKMADKVDNVWQLIHGLKEKSKQAAQR